jgi:predicted acetyltransferase
MSEPLLTCAESNAASARIIERCGGRRVPGPGRRRYLVPLSEGPET